MIMHDKNQVYLKKQYIIVVSILIYVYRVRSWKININTYHIVHKVYIHVLHMQVRCSYYTRDTFP